jgi:hypothetical protein
MFESEDQQRDKEFEARRRKHVDPTWAKVENSLIDVRIQAYRETIEFLEARIKELEAEKYNPEAK